MRLAVLLLAAAASVAAPGCATIPACPAKGGRQWRELTTRNFTLRTDLDEADARETIRQLEEIRAAILAVFWPGPLQPPFRTNAVVLRSVIEFTAFTRDPHSPPEIWGFRRNDPPFEPIIALAGTDQRSLPVLVHNLVHDLSAWYVPVQPAWFSEGLATFLETATYDRRNGVFEFGLAPAAITQSVLEAPLPAPVLLDDRFSEWTRYLGTFEPRAWLLFSFLINTRPGDLDRLLAAVAATKPTSEAWALALPDLSIDRLDEALDTYKRGTWGILRRALSIPAPEIKVREMTDAEVHVVWAQLLRSSPVPGVAPDVGGVRRQLDEALASDPTNTEAFARRLFWGTPPDQWSQYAAASQRIAEAHADDWLAWLLVARTSTSSSLRRTALVRALANDRNQPAVLSDLAAIDLAEGRFDEALAFAMKGMSFRQYVWELAFKAMQAQMALGHCEDAAQLAQVIRTRGPRILGAVVDHVGPASVACRPSTAARGADPALPAPGSP